MNGVALFAQDEARKLASKDIAAGDNDVHK
jgi:hypothetical protein